MEQIWSCLQAASAKMMSRRVRRSVAACPGLALLSIKLGTGPRAIRSTIPDRVARCGSSYRGRTSRSPAIHDNCSHGEFPDNLVSAYLSSVWARTPDAQAFIVLGLLSCPMASFRASEDRCGLVELSERRARP